MQGLHGKHFAQGRDLKGIAPDRYVLVHRALTGIGNDPGNLLEIAGRAKRGDWLERRRAPVMV